MPISNLPPPPVPQRLREMLKDYPGHIERLQEALGHIKAGPNLMPFDQAIWLLEGCLETFESEASKELDAAEACGEEGAIEAAKIKRFVMGSAQLDMGSLEDLADYFQKYKAAFE